MPIQIVTPFTNEKVKSLKVGEQVLISGTIYTGRDAAHQRMCQALERGESLPFDIQNQIIYYVGPCPPKPGQIIGSCGPTTSGRMDAYAPKLIEKGLTGMIGKGLRDQQVIKSMVRFGAVYFGAIGGAGALISQCITNQEIVAYEDLGTEAIRKLTVKNLPVVVIVDSEGKNLYEQGRKKYEVNEIEI